MISRDELYQLRRQKIRKEIETASRILNSAIDPLKLGDSLIHTSFKILRDKIAQDHPNLKETEINQKIKDILHFKVKLTNLKRRKN